MQEKLLDILERIGEDEVVREDLDLDLFEAGLLDSLGFTELLVDIEDTFGIIISPSEIEREDMATANKILALLADRG